jgi:heme O synthase-like polyprenyltransferase
VQLATQRTDAAARRMFHVSLAYLFSLYFAMLIDLAI